ncbi:MAG: hypothetical protein JSR27_00245 [Proteobacteria bacterium]|nr:hypothetical protein [Pseudomonadota bacterium]
MAKAAMAHARQVQRTRSGKTSDRVPVGALSKHEAAELTRFHRRLSNPATSFDWQGRVTTEFIKTWCAALDEFGANGGPRNKEEDLLLYAEYGRIWKAASEGRFSVEQLQRLLHAEGPKYAKAGPFYPVLFRTAGYAGSAQTLELMHNDMGLSWTPPETPGYGYLRFCNESHSSLAVRDRTKTVVGLALEESRKRLPCNQFKVASYAGGTGRFATTLLAALPRDSHVNIHVSLFDVDPRATVTALNRVRRHGMGANCSLRCVNLLSNREFDTTSSGFQEVFDFAECSGLFDYLPAEVTPADAAKGRSTPAFGSMIKKMFETIAPGGLLVVGNFARDHPNQAYMELGNWSLILRDENELETLVRRYAGLDESRGDSVCFSRVAPGTTQILIHLRKGARRGCAGLAR